TRSQERMLERTAIDLWSKLLDEFSRASEAEPPRTTAERQRFVSSRDALLGLFMRLHAVCKRPAERGGNRRKRKDGNRYERLYDRLCTVPLLELSNGRWISAEVAERERPLELAALELWTGPSAEELAHQRAVERREAERQRQAQIEEQRRAEAERRRAAAEAREREAARRREAQRKAEAEREAAERETQRLAAEREAAAKLVTPEQQLLEDLREELRLVRAENRGLLANRLLDSLVLGSPVRRGPLFRRADGTIEIDTGHRLFQAVLAGYLEHPALLTLLASSAYTFLNIVHIEIADEHEAEFLRLHAAHASTGSIEGP
ncbi:MAG TPA: hypothetical protein VM869_04585, partial [Enhygromyxa sp.]|nr:hypothetical protein [Enhygromyxa sp.]